MTAGPAKRVYLVDDDDDARGIVTHILERAGHSVASAADGQQALLALRAQHPAPDVIFVDLVMPVMDGSAFVLAQSADPALRDIAVVVMSAHPSNHPKLAGLNVRGYLKKPFDIDALLAAVATHAG